MKTIKYIAPILALACISFTSCEDEPNGGNTSELKTIELTEGELVIAKQNNQFAWNMFSYANAVEGNTIVSPLSASYAVCMTADGANGETRDEIYRAFGFENCNSDDINGYMQKLSSQLMSLDSKTTLAIANSLWYNEKYDIYDSYISNLKTYYDAEVKLLGANAVNDINNWCSKKTKGLIKKLLYQEDIPTDIAAILINALYFKGEWKEKFDKKDSFKGDFYTIDNTTSKVDFMSGKKSAGYTKAETFTMASLDFGNRSFSARFILPNEDKTLNDCIEEIKTTGWEQITRWYTIHTKYTVKIPKFTIANNLNMKPIYQKMGITSAFNSSADFSNMSSISSIYVTDAFQSNYFKIDETGATAASASGMVTGDGASRLIPPFILDRPFIFALTEQSTGAILFIGKIEKL